MRHESVTACGKTALMNEKAIQISGIYQEVVGHPVLRGLDLKVRRGEIVMLLGPPGSGKTTLLRTLRGLYPVQRGSVQLAGMELARLGGRRLQRRCRRHLAVMMSHHAMPRRDSALQTLLRAGAHSPLVQRLFPRLGQALQEQALACLARVGVRDTVAVRPLELLSAETRQRVAIAAVLMRECNIVLADMPTAGLDREAAHRIMELITRIARERGLTLVCALRDPALAMRHGDRVVGMQAGRIQFDQPVQSVGALVREMRLREAPERKTLSVPSPVGPDIVAQPPGIPPRPPGRPFPASRGRLSPLHHASVMKRSRRLSRLRFPSPETTAAASEKLRQEST